MQFTVPQIEYETKIVGPLTIKQFAIIGVAGLTCFVLFFTLGKTNFSLFIIITGVLMVSAIILAFVRVGGKSLPAIMADILKFSVAPKIYLWKKKDALITIFKKEEIKKEEVKERAPLRVSQKSQLKKLRTFIETKGEQ